MRKTPAATYVHSGVARPCCFLALAQLAAQPGVPVFFPVLGFARRCLTTDCCESFRVWSPRGTSTAEKSEKNEGTKLREGRRLPGSPEEFTKTRNPFLPFVWSPLCWVATPSLANSLAGLSQRSNRGFDVTRFWCPGAYRGFEMSRGSRCPDYQSWVCLRRYSSFDSHDLDHYATRDRVTSSDT